MWTGIDKKTKKFGKASEKDWALSKNLLIRVFFDKSLYRKYPKEVKLIRLIGIPAYILFIIELILILYLVLISNL
ncbi:MAG: hypothetical protein AABX03_00910 [Nanoarchaeota archaeon]